MYDDFDEFWCREYLPIGEQFAKLDDGNRYHEMLATRISAANSSRYLIKPEDGFVSDDHEAFFMTSFKTNVNRGMALVTGKSGFINGKVYAQLDDDPELEVVADAYQPIWGMAVGAVDKSRQAFEAWWTPDTSGYSRAIRFAWRIQGIVAKMAAGDKMYALEPTPTGAKRAATAYPGWRVDDGSKPVL